MRNPPRATGEDRHIPQDDEAAGLRATLLELRRELAALRVEVDAGRWALEALHRSSSWRLTAPVRGLASRFPALQRRLRHVWQRDDGRIGPVVRLLRTAWRFLSGRRRLPRAAEPASLAPVRPALAGRGEAAQWFFVGDTLDWLAAGTGLTGVGRVTTALFAAAWAGDPVVPWRPCVAAEGGVGLAAYRTGAAGGGSAFDAALAASVAAGPGPQDGDHVLFTGAIWNATYAALFARLRNRGVRFSVLVHDIIPIERPDLATRTARSDFIVWLRAAARDADVIFVSCAPVRDRLLAWCVGEDLLPRHPIEIVAFGNSLPGPPAAGMAPRTGLRRPYALSVGTIDARKNQALLCSAWVRLTEALGAGRVPQLVLAGREDLPLAPAGGTIEAAIRQNAILILRDADDEELDRLYREAAFTIFPSLSEGYGLPVAESLCHGKLPVSADLPPIREFAGSLPWYFDPADEAAAYRMLRRAVEQPDEVAAAERRIQENWQPKSWHDAVLRMAAALARADAADSGVGPAFPRMAIPFAQIRRIAGPWCVADEPLVSILMIHDGDTRRTIGCVRHIWANTTGISYEIVIADHGPAPREPDALHVLGGLMQGVRILPLGTYRYPGEANNILAEQARGRLICLLANSIVVSPGWLQALCAALQDHAGAGAVGPLIVSADTFDILGHGGMVGEDGFVQPPAGGEPIDAITMTRPQRVDFLSADAMLLHREAFLQAGGFDLAYEPGGYEDAELGFQLACLGREVWLCPEVAVRQLATGSTGATDGDALSVVNRAKFLSRWGDYLHTRDEVRLMAVRADFAARAEPALRQAIGPRRRALIFTPYMLTPGGGERYLLTFAFALLRDHDVTLATPHPYSRLRLRNLGREFGIDLADLAAASAPELDALPPFDVMVSMGNLIVPFIRARAPTSLYHCQFPFAFPEGEIPDPDLLAGYSGIIVNSEYTRQHAIAALARHSLPRLAVDVVYPPVPRMAGEARQKREMILSVGRFFVGGHVKRHDLMIEAFRCLTLRHGGPIELHLAGSTMPRPDDIAYLQRLRDMSNGLPVFIHANCPAAKLASLYGDAAFYWHGTGLATDLEQYPERAEHFGISIVEAMSAECVAFALNAGGAREIITHGADGFLYGDMEELVAETLDLLSPEQAGRRMRIGMAAGERARRFSQDVFRERARAAVRQDVLF